MSMYPILVSLNDYHGLEANAKEGKDYFTNVLVTSEKDLASLVGKNFTILAKNVGIYTEKSGCLPLGLF